MLEAKQLSYKKFAVHLDVPVYSVSSKWSYMDGDKWITLKYMVRYRIPISTEESHIHDSSGRILSTGRALKPCDDKKFLKDFFERKFKGGYVISNALESVKLEDGRTFSIVVPAKIRVN